MHANAKPASSSTSPAQSDGERGDQVVEYAIGALGLDVFTGLFRSGEPPDMMGMIAKLAPFLDEDTGGLPVDRAIRALKEPGVAPRLGLYLEQVVGPYLRGAGPWQTFEAWRGAAG